MGYSLSAHVSACDIYKLANQVDIAKQQVV